METIDFIYEDAERGITILVRTHKLNKQYNSAIKIASILYSFDWIRIDEPQNNQIEAIIYALNKLFHDVGEKDITYYKDLIYTLADALDEAKKLRFQQLNLFEDGSARKTHRIQKNVPQSSRRKDKSQLSIYD